MSNRYLQEKKKKMDEETHEF
jgi:thioesterase domain-containing protein